MAAHSLEHACLGALEGARKGVAAKVKGEAGCHRDRVFNRHVGQQGDGVARLCGVHSLLHGGILAAALDFGLV